MNFFTGIFGHDVWTVHGWLHFSWFGISASSVIFKLREFYEGPPCSISYFSVNSSISTLFPYPKHMLWAQYISMSLPTVICECSLNQFCTSLFVSLFVHWEPQQIFMGLNGEYRVYLVKARVKVPITLLCIYWVCQYKLFLYQKVGRGLPNCLLNLQNLLWNIVGVIFNKYFQQQYRI